MASKKKTARKKAIRKTIKRLNASVSLIACTGESQPVAAREDGTWKTIGVRSINPEPIKAATPDLNQRLEPCAREGCDSTSQVGDRLCKRHRIAMEESRARHR